MDLVQRLHWFADTQDTAIFWGGCEGHFPLDDMRLAATKITSLERAAPDMLAALQGVAPTDFHDHPRDFAPEWHAVIAAIAKATTP